MTRILGIDYGTKHIGLALGDPLTGLAVPLEVIDVDGKDAVKAVWAMIDADGYDHVVIGTPLSQDGETTKMSEQVEKFAESLRQVSGVNVDLVNERLTSKVSDMMAREVGGEHDDALAAMLIVQEFLNENRG